MSCTYVYNGIEVKKTGREAFKKGRSKTIFLYEITPVDIDDGSWKKWVQETELYTVKESTSK